MLIAGVLFSLLLDFEDGSDVLLQNVGICQNYTMLQPGILLARGNLECVTV
jgi:hypothetical protein